MGLIFLTGLLMNLSVMALNRFVLYRMLWFRALLIRLLNLKRKNMDLKEKFKSEKKIDAYAYDSNNQIIGFCENYVEWLENKITKSDFKDDFEKAVEPAIRYLFKNHNPHTKIFIDYGTAELLQGERCHNLNDEVPD